jgi:hypothetical protein
LGLFELFRDKSWKEKVEFSFEGLCFVREGLKQLRVWLKMGDLGEEREVMVVWGWEE